jgi:citrate synthase
VVASGCVGYPLEEIIEKLSFVEAMWLLLRGELPTSQQAAVWELAIKVAMDQQFISSATCAFLEKRRLQFKGR